MLNDASPQRAKVVSALKQADDSSLAMSIGDTRKPAGHFTKTCFAQFDLRKRIFAMGIEAGGDQKKLRYKLIQSGHHDLIECRQIFGVSRAGSNGILSVYPRPTPTPCSHSLPEPG